MDASQFEARLKELDPRLKKIYHDAKALTEEMADTLGDNFELSAMIMRVFSSYLARTERAAGKEAKKRQPLAKA